MNTPRVEESILIVVRKWSPEVREVASLVARYLHDHGSSVYVDFSFWTEEHPPIDAPQFKQQCSPSCIFSIGGDGTMLYTFHQYQEYDVPILGINAGSLGFMASISVESLHASLEEFYQSKYVIERRQLLSYTTFSGKTGYGVNDLVVHRGIHRGLVHIQVDIDGCYLNTFRSDGLIVATPTGSTAYSLSSGGPIMMRNVRALILTTISPHTISNRPVVVLPNQEMKLTYLDSKDTFDPSEEGLDTCVDGRELPALERYQSITVSIPDRTIRTILLNRNDELATLRSKLRWSGTLT